MFYRHRSSLVHPLGLEKNTMIFQALLPNVLITVITTTMIEDEIPSTVKEAMTTSEIMDVASQI